VRIRPEKVPGIDFIVGKVAASPARRKNFSAGALGVVENEDLPPAPGCFHGTEKTGSPGTDDEDVDPGHVSCPSTLFILHLLFSERRE
jgi:hypothetical protein